MAPITFHHSWKKLDERDRLTAMREFAANGAHHLVLTDTLLKMMGQDYQLAGVLRRQIAEAGVDFVDAHAPFHDFGDLFIPDEHDRRQMIARQKLNLLLVGEMGADTCTFHPGSSSYPGYSAEEHRAALYRSLDELLPVARELGIVICLENGLTPLNSAEALVSYMRKYDSPHLGVCFDTGHANLKELGELVPDSSVPQVWEKYGMPVRWEQNIAERLQPYIVSCHIHDNYGVRDDHDLPGRGNIDWRRIVKVLSGAPRLRNIQSEVLTARRNIPIRTVCESLRKLFGDGEMIQTNKQ